MLNFHRFLDIFLTKTFFKKIFAYSLLILFIYFFRDFGGIFLLTFIFAYLFLSLSKFFKNKLDIFINKHKRNFPKLVSIKKFYGVNLFIILIYTIFIGIIIFVISDLLPKLTTELGELGQNIPFLNKYFQDIAGYLQILREGYTEIGGTVEKVIAEDNYALLLEVFNRLKSVSLILLQVILALFMSFIFVIDRNKLYKYLACVKTSNFKFLYKEYEIIFNKIIKSFGLILKAQSMIALLNMIITITGFYIIGLFYGGFPYILTLAIIVFIFSYVPILGMWISGIPLSIIAYLNGGVSAMLFVVLMIFSSSSFEAYFLNPKIVSSYFKLPISLTFVILIVSENIFGVAGLLIGISLFYFILGLLGDIDNLINKNKKKI